MLVDSSRYHVRFRAYQGKDTSGVLLLVSVLDEVEEALAGLAGPGSDRVGELGLLAAQVLLQVGGRDGLFAEPEVLLGEAESAERVVSLVIRRSGSAQLTSSVLGPCTLRHRCGSAPRP